MRMVVRYGGVGWVVFCVVVHRTAVPNMWNTFRCLLQTRINNRIIDKYVNCRDAPSGTTKSAYAQAERIYAKRVRDPFVQKCMMVILYPQEHLTHKRRFTLIISFCILGRRNFANRIWVELRFSVYIYNRNLHTSSG